MDKKVEPPFKPTVTSPDDTRNIDQMFLREDVKETLPMMNMSSFHTRQQNHFEYFTYISNRMSGANLGNSNDPTLANSHHMNNLNNSGLHFNGNHIHHHLSHQDIV